MERIGGGNARTTQVATAKESGFTARKRERFLDALALTCNVTKAAAHAGVHPSTIYKTRAKETVFAEQLQMAMEIGFDRLEALVLEHGGAGVPIDIDPTRAEQVGVERNGADGNEGTPPPFDFDRAMQVLIYRRGTRAGEPNRRTGRPVRNATREETNAALMKALAAAHKRMAKAAEKEAAAAQGAGHDG